MFEIYVTFVIGLGETKVYHYLGSVSVAKARVDWAKQQPNTYSIEVRGKSDWTGVQYSRNDDQSWHSQVIGDDTLKVLALEVYGYDINHVASLAQVDTKP
jgi:hypothetical protein